MRYVCGWVVLMGMALAAEPRTGACGMVGLPLVAALASPAQTESKKLGQMAAAARFTSNEVAIATMERRTTGVTPDVCDPAPPAKTSFSSADPQVFQWTSATGAAAGDVIRWEWVRPNGSVHATQQLTLSFQGTVCFWAGIPIAGQAEVTGSPGNWQVRVFYNGAQVFADTFTIFSLGGAGGRLCTRNLQSFYVGSLTLGFAAVRASCNVGQVLPPPVVALMVSDLHTTATGVAAMAPCLQFDTSQLTGLAARLSGMRGEVALQEIEALYRNLQVAVRQSGMTCDLGLNAGALESFYVAALQLGFAAARATCFVCQEPLPPEVVNLIRTDLNNAQNGLRAFAACLPALDFGQFANVRLGAPFTMMESYNDLVALYAAVQSAVANTECCCSCSSGGGGAGGTGTVGGTVRNASNGLPVAGAAVAVASTSLTATTAADGIYSIANVAAGQRTLNASATGFIPTQVNVNVVASQTVTQNISLSPVLQAGQTRITLNWTKDSAGRPRDLDMHLTGPNPDGTSCFHIYFSSKGRLDAAPFAQLEVDNIQVTGDPPTETIRLSQLTPGTYGFYVHNYSGDGDNILAQSRPTVQVFGASGLQFSQTLSAGSGRYWTVFTMNGQTGAITGVNQVTASAPATACR